MSLLSSMSLSSKWIEPEEGVLGTLIYTQFIKSTDNNLGLWLVSEIGGQGTVE